jgi:hypothetical protein
MSAAGCRWLPSGCQRLDAGGEILHLAVDLCHARGQGGHGLIHRVEAVRVVGLLRQVEGEGVADNGCHRLPGATAGLELGIDLRR